MVYHTLLKRQLRRIGLGEDQAPTLEQWQELLKRIDKVYQESDQERYLNKIANEVSSRETTELNLKLESAQQIAHLGYWYYDRETGSITWSKEMYNLYNCDPAQPIPSFDELLNRFSEEDRNILKSLIDYAWMMGEDYELEAKIKNDLNDKDRWFYFAGHAHVTMDNKPRRYLSGIAMDITKRKESEDELHKLNLQLAASARKAGMAEIATGVLHNIGNILNSVNISAELIKRSIQELDIDNISTAIKMIHENLPIQKNYLTEDPKGKLIPAYLLESKKIMEINYGIVNKEIARLNEKITHIKEIVSIQNTFSGVSKMIEEVSLSEVINAAVMVVEDTLKKNGIQLEKNYDSSLAIQTDKNKIMQILLNLLQNAKDALIVVDPTLIKKISISSKINPNKKDIEISITDTGLGISADNLTKVFSFGFTTKLKGHGFGLHSSALLAKELGGELHVESEGIGHGSTFTLTLPMNSIADRSEMYERSI